jgi:hypothetical protein
VYFWTNAKYTIGLRELIPVQPLDDFSHKKQRRSNMDWPVKWLKFHRMLLYWLICLPPANEIIMYWNTFPSRPGKSNAVQPCW